MGIKPSIRLYCVCGESWNALEAHPSGGIHCPSCRRIGDLGVSVSPLWKRKSGGRLEYGRLATSVGGSIKIFAQGSTNEEAKDKLWKQSMTEIARYRNGGR